MLCKENLSRETVYRTNYRILSC